MRETYTCEYCGLNGPDELFVSEDRERVKWLLICRDCAEAHMCEQCGKPAPITTDAEGSWECECCGSIVCFNCLDGYDFKEGSPVCIGCSLAEPRVGESVQTAQQRKDDYIRWRDRRYAEGV